MHMQETSNIQNNVFLLLQKGLHSFILFGVPQIQPQEFGAKYDEKLSLEISNHPFNFQRSCVRTLFLENPISSTQCHSDPLVTGYIHF